MTTNMTTNVEADTMHARFAARVNRGDLCRRCGLGHGTLHPVDGSSHAEHVDSPGCDLIRTLLVQIRHDLAVAR